MNKNKFMQYYEDSNELYIYGDIADYKWFEEDVTANEVRQKIQNFNGDILNVHINSYGGDVFTGIAIYNLLKNTNAQVNVYIDSCACSIASVIAMAGDKIYMPKNTLMMIHNCWTVAQGNSKDLRKQADDLDVIMEASIESYMSRIKITREELQELLDDETWLTAEKCVELGFADEILEQDDKGVHQSVALFKLLDKVNQKVEQVKPLEETTTETVAEEIQKEEKEEETTQEVVVEEKKPSFAECFLKTINERNDNNE